MNFENNIITWVTYDTEIRKLNDKLKNLREKKNNLTNDIFNYVNNNNINNTVVKITDGKLKFTTVKTYTPLTFKYIYDCLNDIIDDPEKVKEIITYLKNKRENKYVDEIKRFYS